MFKSTPSIQYPINTNSTVKITNCDYYSPYQMPTSYWLKNGIIRLNHSNEVSRKRRNLVEKYPNIQAYHVQDLVLRRMSYEDQGYYQCVIKDRTVLVLSEKVYVQLSGMYVCARLYHPYLAGYELTVRTSHFAKQSFYFRKKCETNYAKKSKSAKLEVQYIFF